MNKSPSSIPNSSSLDDILAELESRFGSTDNKSPKKKSSKKKSFLSSAQSFYAALGLVLLVVGAGIATLLTQRQQDLRQQAAISPYDICCQVNDGGIHYIITANIDYCLSLQGGTPVDDSYCIPTSTPNPQLCTDGDLECIGKNAGDGCDTGNVKKCTNESTTGGGVCICQYDICAGGYCASSAGCANGETPQQAPDGMCTASFLMCCPGTPNVCSDSDPTAPACKGVGVDQPCNGFNGICRQTNNDGSSTIICACVANATNTPIPSIIISQLPTATPGQGGDPTNTPAPSATNTPRPSNIPRPSNTPTTIPSHTPTLTPSETPIPTITPTFTPSSTPEPSATPAPMCINITMTNPFRGDGEASQIGDNVTFTCGEVSFAQKYEFRIKLPDTSLQIIDSVPAGSRVSAPFTLNQSGQYKAQCRVCNDVDGNYCGEWEAL